MRKLTRTLTVLGLVLIYGCAPPAMNNDSDPPPSDPAPDAVDFPEPAPDYALDGMPLEDCRERVAGLSKQLQKDPDDVDTRLKRAEANLLVRRFAEAEADATLAIAKRPDDLTPRILRAESFLLREEIEKAEAEYKAVFEGKLPDESVRGRALAGRALLKTFLIDPPGAVDDLTAALKSSRDGYRWYAILSTGVVETAEYGNSVEQENLALLRQPTSVPVLENRALTLAALDMWLGWPLAALDRTVVIELAPDSVEVLQKRAEYWQYFAYNQNDTELEERSVRRAVVDYTALLRLSPDNMELLSERASCLRELGNHQEALRDVERILELRPDDSEVRGERAMLLVYLGQKEEGLRMLDNLVERARRSTPIDRSLLRGLLCCLSDVHSRLGQHEAAIADLTLAIETAEGETKWLRLSRAYAYIEAGQIDLAREHFDHLIENEKPHSAQAHLMRANFFAKIGDYRKALADIDEAGRRDDADADVAFERARVLHKMGREEESEAARKEAVRLDPTLRNVKVQ